MSDVTPIRAVRPRPGSRRRSLPKISLDIPPQQFEKESFRLAVESSLGGIVVTDRDGMIVMVNSKIERIFGYLRRELIRQPIEMLVPLPSRESHTPNLQDLTDIRRMGIGGALHGLRQDGTKFPVEVTLSPIRMSEELFVLSTIVDIGERRRSEDMFRLAVEACPSGMIMADRVGRIIIANTEIERLFGYAPWELVGQFVQMLVPERLRNPDAPHSWQSPMRPEATADVQPDLLGLRKNGTEFPIEVGLNLTHVGAELVYLSAIMDITERKRNDRMKDEFVSTVSHELRTPMTSIAGSLGLLIGGAGGILPDSAKRLIGIAHGNCQRLVRLVNDILDIQKLEFGGVTFKFDRVDVRSLVQRTLDAMSGFAEGYGVRLRLDDSSVSAEVRADIDRLEQVVTNLVSNAVKFSPAQQEVVIGVTLRESSVCISVRDHGVGIPESFKPHIFEKFSQADGTDRRQNGGTGLGLSIVQQIVIAQGGQVSFCEAAGGGTIFNVELPAWKEAHNFRQEPDVASDNAGIAV